MNFVEKAGAYGLAAITALGLIGTVAINSGDDQLRPYPVSQEEAEEKCGGRADLRWAQEDVGDGTVAVFEVYRCPDGRQIPVIAWRRY